MMEAILFHRQCRVTSIGLGGEAQDYFLEHMDDFDIVLIDLYLPQANGIELVKIIRRERPKLPVVVITGLRDAPEAEAAIKLGVRAVYEKPIRPDMLMEEIGSAMGNLGGY